MITIKPTIGRTNIAQKFNDIIYDGLPVNKWCREQDIKRKNKKF